MARKWVINKGDFMMGHVEFHKEFNSKEENKFTVGGGYWHLIADDKIVLLYGNSVDFGDVTDEDFLTMDLSGAPEQFTLHLSRNHSLGGAFMDLENKNTLILKP